MCYALHTMGCIEDGERGVYVDDGWFKHPPLARVRLIGLWGWVRAEHLMYI